jgi:hypothetical protein
MDDDLIKRLRAQEHVLCCAQAADAIEKLVAALEEIRDDDRAESHPCGPQLYGHFGSLAAAALKEIGVPLKP